MAAAVPPPRSILKKTVTQSKASVPANVNLPPPRTDQEARNLRTAILHAEQIQAQKDTQLLILEKIESLSLLPSQTPAPAKEVEEFRNDVGLFQPSDYGALLEERNVNGFCGYTLCGKPPRESNQGRKWMRPEGGRRFCGKDCARKAMYVRAQLDEVPAWERRVGLESKVVLPEEAFTSDVPTRRKGDAGAQSNILLAEERGDSTDGQRAKLVTDDVVEKHPTGRPKPAVQFSDLLHDSVEGYRVSTTRLCKFGKADND